MAPEIAPTTSATHPWPCSPDASGPLRPSAALTAQTALFLWLVKELSNGSVRRTETVAETNRPLTSVMTASRREPGATRAGNWARTFHSSTISTQVTTTCAMDPASSAGEVRPNSAISSGSPGPASVILSTATVPRPVNSLRTSKAPIAQSSAARFPRSRARPTTAR